MEMVGMVASELGIWGMEIGSMNRKQIYMGIGKWEWKLKMEYLGEWLE